MYICIRQFGTGLANKKNQTPNRYAVVHYHKKSYSCHGIVPCQDYKFFNCIQTDLRT